MYNFNKKQKIILGILIATVVSCIYYYVSAKEESNQTQLESQSNLEIQKGEQEEEKSEDRILVHVSGAVNKEGVVEIQVNSRIYDAIEKARRCERRC